MEVRSKHPPFVGGGNGLRENSGGMNVGREGVSGLSRLKSAGLLAEALDRLASRVVHVEYER
jgi:hypothetical protein